jgi:hypothetical protein
MTTLIQQKSQNDCVLAAIAMAAGASAWEDLWTEEDLQKVITSKGIANMDPWLKRAGITEWMECYVRDDRTAHRLLWQRRALLSVNSLNNPGGTHMVYWDGEKLWDPHEGHYPEFLAFRHLQSLSISEIYIFPLNEGGTMKQDSTEEQAT